MVVFETERLIVRNWQDSDRPAFYQMSADPDVMAFYPNPLTVQECDNWLNKVSELTDKNGYSFWACQLKSTGEFIGFVGLNKPDYQLPFSPCTEIGWRLAKKHWKNGYASEAATYCLGYAFKKLGLTEVVSFAVKSNVNSIKVMERIGMVNMHANFIHPDIELEHLKEHILYKIAVQEYNKMLESHSIQNNFDIL